MAPMDRDDPAWAGQRDYTRALLSLYDPLVVGPIARFVWRCPKDRLVAGYRRHIRDRHLDVGPGTGYFIARSGLAPGSSVTILDPNLNVLRHAGARLRAFDVTAVEADVLKPLPVRGPFASAAIHMVIHCLPGPAARKATALANLASVLEPDGVLFGASVLGRSGDHNRVARGMLQAFNRQGGFDNLDDSVESIRDMLAAAFDEVELDSIGSVVVFSARRPRPVPGRSADARGLGLHGDAA